MLFFEKFPFLHYIIIDLNNKQISITDCFQKNFQITVTFDP